MKGSIRNSAEYREWARLGASVRVLQLQAERAAILKLFPELAKAHGEDVTKKRRTMSPEARKRMSEGMKRYWARRRAVRTVD